MIGLNDPGLLCQACFIQDQWIEADSKKNVGVTNPATGDILGTVPFCGAGETRRAIDAANESLSDWRSKTASERSAILRRWNDLLMENQEDLALLMTAEQGKPMAESRGEIAYAASFFEWFAEEAKRVYGDVIPQTIASQRLVVIKQPVGVVAAITPWNFPSAMIARKAGAALAAGCTMVVKPATSTPFSALAIAKLGQKAGLPPGVFNVVTGSSSAIGAELTANPIVRKLTFTGSTEVGKKLMQDCAGTMKRVSMELGGNAPFIVFDDADLDAAIEGALSCKYRNSGQTCVCANRIYVQAGIYDQFCEKLTQAVTTLKVGNGIEDGVVQGPLIDMNAVESVERHISDALDKGAKVLAGGKRHALGGTFFAPTVLADATDDMLVAKEEIFGPFAPVFKFETEKEVIQKANDTEYGLAAYFFTQNMARTWRVGEQLEYGLIGINSGIISNAVAPFGGVKSSGNGREGSKYGMDDYLEIKYMCMAGIS